MKNYVKHFFSAAILLLLSSAFVSKPDSIAAKPDGLEGYPMLPHGGAYVVFAGKLGGEVTKREMAGQTEVKVEGCAKGARIFDISLTITKGGQTTTFKTNSGVLTSDMRAKLNSLSKGDSFEFLNTKAYLGNNNDVVDVHGRKFFVV